MPRKSVVSVWCGLLLTHIGAMGHSVASPRPQTQLSLNTPGRTTQQPRTTVDTPNGSPMLTEVEGHKRADSSCTPMGCDSRWQEGICGRTLWEGWKGASRNRLCELSFPFYSVTCVKSRLFMAVRIPVFQLQSPASRPMGERQQHSCRVVSYTNLILVNVVNLQFMTV